MAAVGDTLLSLADKKKRENPDGSMADIVEMLSQVNPILQDAPAVACNDGYGHLTTLRTKLPSVSWRIINQGTAESKSGTSQVRDTTGELDAWGQVDVKLVKTSKDSAKFRMMEAKSFIEAMGIEAAASLFYADTNSDPEEILGLAPRYNSLTGQDNSNQVIAGGGAGSTNTSMWFVNWGEDTVHLIYPDGETAGLSHEDLGIDTVLDANGNPMRAFRDNYKWDLGIALRDWRSVVRICNIDVALLTEDAASGANLFRLMIEAYWKIPPAGRARGTGVIYCNTTIMRFLDNQAREGNSNTILTWRETGPESKPVLFFRDMAIRETDALLETEATIS